MAFVLINEKNGNKREFATRAEAEEEKAELEGIGANLELVEQGASTGEVEAEVIDMSPDDDTEDDEDEQVLGVDVCVHCGNDIEDGHCPDCEGDEESEAIAEVAEKHDEDSQQLSQAVATANEISRSNKQKQQKENTPEVTNGGAELDRTPNVTEDPISWMPKHFVDTIDGAPAINRKGYAVLAEHYGISVKAEPVTYPSESDWEYAEFRAIATTPDGDEYSGFGSAHVERGKKGDDKTLLGELAETRAIKRATANATGIGMTAVSEMKGDAEVVE